MIRTRKAPGIIVVAGLAGALAGCGFLPFFGDEKDMKTPQQARTELTAEITAIAEAVMPGHRAEVVSDPASTDLGCGGPAGTEDSKLYSNLSAGIEDPGLKASPEEIMRLARQTLTNRGWEILGEETVGGNPKIRFTNAEGAGGSLIFGPPEKAIQIDAHTPCLDNPES